MADAGKERLNIVFQPVEGKAIPMQTGEVLRITQLGNGQCADFNCFKGLFLAPPGPTGVASASCGS